MQAGSAPAHEAFPAERPDRDGPFRRTARDGTPIRRAALTARPTTTSDREHHVSYPAYQPAPAFAAAPPPSRPTTLNLAFFGALLSGLLGLVGSILLYTGAHDVAVKQGVGADNADALGQELTDSIVSDAVHTLQLRGISGIVSAALIVVFALAARNAATWARVVLTVLLVGGLCAGGVAVADIAPAATKGLDVTAIVLNVVVVVLLFLPPTNAYAKARKQRPA
jgi:hypothetical protein